MLTLAMLVGLLLVSLLTSAGILWGSARLVRAGNPSYKRALGCTLVLAAIGIPLQLLFASFPRNDLIIAGIELLVGLLLCWTIAARVFKITFPRSMLLSVPYFLLSIPIAMGTVYFIKAYCFEAFIIPTNSMAPTLIGWHHEAVCPHCQGKAIIPARPPGDDFGRFDQLPAPKPGICTQCRKISEFEKWSEELHTPMRMICNKWQQPERGDPIVFIYPRNPEPEQKVMYVQRLVGMPGEKIEIKDEAVWINGSKWTPPSDLSGIVYYPRPFPFPDPDMEPRTWELGPHEFFVLGDFTTNSSDSREWGPVPRANLVGAATLIYWPPSAMRILR